MLLLLLVAAGVFAAIAIPEWHPAPLVRRAAAIVAVTLLLWISEAAPLGLTALLIPVLGTWTGILGWKEAVAPWGDPIIFLFLGAFLLARALDKHGAFGQITGRGAAALAGGSGVALAGVVLAGAGVLSLAQNNTAVTAMLLPVVLPLARRTAQPALPLLALSYGATFGGMATPVGTAPNFQGFAAIKEIDESASFISWMAIGAPIWLGTSLIGWGVLAVRARFTGAAHAGRPDLLPAARPDRSGALAAQSAQTPASPPGQLSAAAWVAVAAFAATVAAWLTVGVIQALPVDPALRAWTQRYVPEALPPVVASAALFLVRAGPGSAAVLDRHDFQVLDWDTLFLIAGGLCLGSVLNASGADDALAERVGGAQLTPLVLYLALGGVTVLLSELTSNTATAALMIPLASSIAPAVGEPATKLILLVAMAASLGFALPVSTPPNALIYGTRQVPLRTMAGAGVVTDVLTLIWVIACVRWLG